MLMDTVYKIFKDVNDNNSQYVDSSPSNNLSNDKYNNRLWDNANDIDSGDVH